MELHYFGNIDFVLEVPAALAATDAFAPAASPRCDTCAREGDGGDGGEAGGADRPQELSPAMLLEVQTSMYELCSPSVRRRVHYFYDAQAAWAAQRGATPDHSRAAAAAAAADGGGGGGEGGTTGGNGGEGHAEAEAEEENMNPILFTSMDVVTGGGWGAAAPTSTGGGGDGVLAAASPGSGNAHHVPPAPERVCFVRVLGTSGGLTEEQRATVTCSLRRLRDSTRGAGGGAPEGLAAERQRESQADSAAGGAYVLLRVTDSRVAAALLALALQSGALAVARGCRLLPVQRPTAARQVPTYAEQHGRLLARRARYNLDEELWGAVEAARRLPAVAARMAAAKAYAAAAREGEEGGGGGRLLTAEERRARRVRALLAYGEAEVHYGGVLDADEHASPFLLALVLLFELGLTAAEVRLHVLTHPRRVLRVLGLLAVRLALPCEELGPFFYEALHDQTRIATAAEEGVRGAGDGGGDDDDEGDGGTATVAGVARRLLLRGDALEAFLPLYAPPLLEGRVRPMVAQMQRHAAAAAATSTAGTFPATVPQQPPAGGESPDSRDDGGRRQQPPRRGAAALLGGGVGSLQALAALVRDEQRALRPKRMAAVLSHHRRPRHSDDGGDSSAAGGHARRDDEDDADEGLDDDFLINVRVTGGGGGGGGEAEAAAAARQRARVEVGSPNTRGPSRAEAAPGGRAERLNATKWVLTSGYRAVLSLLGRTQPFDRFNEHTLEW